MPIVEHNDVDISPLFAWSKEFEVTAKDHEPVKVFMRVLGDADMNRARVAALRRSAEMRRSLKDENSDNRLAYIKDIDEIDADNLIAVITVFSLKELNDRAVEKLKIKPPKLPRSDAKTSAHEKYQEDVDSYPERRAKELRELLNKEVEAFKQAQSTDSKENLYRKYISLSIDEICEQEMIMAFREWCCYLGSYKDEQLTQRLFGSFEEFANLPSDLKAQFISEYSSLELYGDDLKKLRPVTP